MGAPAEKSDPVIVVVEPGLIEEGLRRAGVPFDGTFVAEVADARGARGDLGRFVRAEVKGADRARAAELRRVLRAAPAYLWHCGGFERGGARYLHCTFVRDAGGVAALREARFPELAGAGPDACRGTYSLQARRLLAITCAPAQGSP